MHVPKARGRLPSTGPDTELGFGGGGPGQGPSHPGYVHCPSTEEGGLLEGPFWSGHRVAITEMLPERQAGQTTRALGGLEFLDNREALKGFQQGNIEDRFSGEQLEWRGWREGETPLQEQRENQGAESPGRLEE